MTPDQRVEMALVPAAPGDPSSNPLEGQSHETRRQDLDPSGNGGRPAAAAPCGTAHDLRCRAPHHVWARATAFALVTGCSPRAATTRVSGFHRGSGSRHRKYKWHLPGKRAGSATTGTTLHLAHDPWLTSRSPANPRKVILHAPKNGFFFVLDRTNGRFISAKNFVPEDTGQQLRQERQAHEHCRGTRRQQTP